jgi:hypothetical protein
MRSKTALKVVPLLAAGLLLGACTSNGTDSGGISGGSSSGGGLANDGTTPTNITDGGTPLSGHFICTQASTFYGDVTTQVGSNGLVGGPLTALLNLLGATTLTQLLNSITNANNVIDGNLDTYASASLTVGLLGGLLSSVDESVLLPSGVTVPAGKYAVYGVSFPKGTVSLGLFNTVKVSTYLNNVQQDSNTLNQSALALLGAVGGSTPATAFIGIKASKPYDRATISLTPGLLSVNVGEAMRIHELCVDGTL